MSIEAELAPLCETPLGQKVVATLIGDLEAIEREELYDLVKDIELARAKIAVGDADRGGIPLHINRARVLSALAELIHSLRAIPR